MDCVNSTSGVQSQTTVDALCTNFDTRPAQDGDRDGDGVHVMFAMPRACYLIEYPALVCCVLGDSVCCEMADCSCRESGICMQFQTLVQNMTLTSAHYD